VKVHTELLQSSLNLRSAASAGRALALAAAMLGGCGDDPAGTETTPNPLTMPTSMMSTGTMPTAMTPTGMMPTGAIPTGMTPTGMMPTGVMPTGVMPTGMMAGTGAAGMTAGTGEAGMTAGTGEAGMMAGTGAAGMTAGTGAAGMMAGTGAAGMMAAGECCEDGDCICRDEPPSSLTSSRGPYATDSYSIARVGCVYYPTDAEPPFSAVAISDGFLGSGGCGSFQTGQWGPLDASHGIVAMIVNTGSADQPSARGRALSAGSAAFKEENEDSGSRLFGKLAGRYGTSGFSMGGGGTTYAAQGDSTLLTNVAIMPWGPVSRGVTVPSLVICGSSDGTAPCSSHGTPFYRSVADSVPKMRIVVSSGHSGQPSAGRGVSGEVGLAFQKLFLDGDERWRPLLVAADSEDTTIR
jgi:hypothetical protein